ncbi:MAG: periplasmic heavy metal sensor [Hyphomonadaceae bacterium]
MSESKFPWRTLLFVSLAVNLLVIGAVAGAMGAGVRLQRQAPDVVVTRMAGPRAFLNALPEEMRPRMRQALAESWVETREARRAAAEARRQAYIAAASEPYDAARPRSVRAGARCRIRPRSPCSTIALSMRWAT